MPSQVDDSPPPALGQLTAPSQEDLANVPNEVVRLLDFLQTGEQDLQFLNDLRNEHIADLERQPIVLRRVDSVKEGAAKALGQVRQVVDGGLDKIRQSRSPFRKRNARKFAESSEFRSQEAVITRHHAAILRELVHLRQLALRSPTPGQRDHESSRDSVVSVVSADSGSRRSTPSISTTSTLGRLDKKFDNIGLLADLMGDATLSDPKPGFPPHHSAVSRATFPVAEMQGSTGRRTDSISSCPPSELVAYAKGSILYPAELSAEPNTTFGPAELVGDIPTGPPTGPVSAPSSNDDSQRKETPVSEPASSPPPQPETNNTAPRRPISFDPTDDRDLQPFSPLDDLTPFIRPPPVVEEKQVVEDSSFFGPSSISVYEEKEVVLRHSQRKKSSQRILLNEQDRAGLALLMGDDMGYGQSVAHKSSTVSLVSASSQTGTSISWPSPAMAQQTTVIPPVPTQAPPPPPAPPVPPKIPHGTIPRKPTPSKSKSTTSLRSQSQAPASDSTETTAPPIQPLTTIPPELLFGQRVTSNQTVPAIVIQEASPS